MKIGILDNICATESKTTCGSKMLENFVSGYDATVIEKLKESNIKTFEKINMSEFGVEENDEIGRTVSNNNVEGIVGSDADGKLRMTASKNKVIGLKPTFGLISRSGVITTAPSLEQVSIIAKDIKTCRELLNIISGYDNRDSCSADVETRLESAQKDISKIKIGVLGDAKYKGATAVKLNIEEYIIPSHYIIWSSEMSSNLGRFDGIRYGYRTKNAPGLFDVYKNSRAEGFGKEVKKIMIFGTHFLSVDYKSKYYDKASKIRTMIKKEIAKQFENFDVIITPVEEKYLKLANLTGHPSLVVNNVQLIGKHFEENVLLELGGTI